MYRPTEISTIETEFDTLDSFRGLDSHKPYGHEQNDNSRVPDQVDSLEASPLLRADTSTPHFGNSKNSYSQAF